MAQVVGHLRSTYSQLVGTAAEGYEQLVNAIIRPPREVYDSAELGQKRFSFQDVVYQREDLELCSSRPGRPLLKCSHFRPEPLKKTEEPPPRPCVIFLHGNSSSRVSGLCVLKTVLAAGADLFCFDFAGCGLSGGDYVSLGHYERLDLAAVMERLRFRGNVTTIGLWGRSMGAATALMYADTDPSIAAMVLDSPFTDLRSLAIELCQKETYGSVPGWLVDAALSVIKKSIQERAGFDIEAVNALSHVARTFVPAMFAVAEGDDFVYPYHSRTLRGKYAGESSLFTMEGDHNSERPQSFLDEAAKFLRRTLHTPYDLDVDARETSSGPMLPIAPGPPDALYAPIPPPSMDEETQEDDRPCRQRGAAGGPSPTSASSRSSAGRGRAPAPPASASAAAPAPPPPDPSAYTASRDPIQIRASLLKLGFKPNQIDKALRRCGTLEASVEWIIENDPGGGQ